MRHVCSLRHLFFFKSSRQNSAAARINTEAITHRFLSSSLHKMAGVRTATRFHLLSACALLRLLLLLFFPPKMASIDRSLSPRLENDPLMSRLFV